MTTIKRFVQVSLLASLALSRTVIASEWDGFVFSAGSMYGAADCGARAHHKDQVLYFDLPAGTVLNEEAKTSVLWSSNPRMPRLELPPGVWADIHGSNTGEWSVQNISVQPVDVFNKRYRIQAHTYCGPPGVGGAGCNVSVAFVFNLRWDRPPPVGYDFAVRHKGISYYWARLQKDSAFPDYWNIVVTRNPNEPFADHGSEVAYVLEETEYRQTQPGLHGFQSANLVAYRDLTEVTGRFVLRVPLYGGISEIRMLPGTVAAGVQGRALRRFSSAFEDTLPSSEFPGTFNKWSEFYCNYTVGFKPLIKTPP